MSQYLPCPQCGSRILNRLQHYDMCACQIPSMIKEEPISEREKRWLCTAQRLFEKGRVDEGKNLVEAVLMDNPSSKRAQDMQWQYQGQCN